MEKILVAGAGTLGSQIAWQTAYHGFQVKVYDAFEQGLEQGRRFHDQFAKLFLETRGASQEAIEATRKRLDYTTDLEEAAQDADLVSESIPEVMEIKQDFYTRLGKVAPPKTLFTTNTSSLLPSSFAHFTGRPERFLALHFSNGIWDNNIGEVMPHAGTDPAATEQVITFAKAIGMVPILIRKEQPGYIFNSLLIPFCGGALKLLANGVAGPEEIDKTWMIGAQMKLGPCAFMDMIGMETIYHILQAQHRGSDQAHSSVADYLKREFIDQGKLGIKTGQGFYTYPNPAYERPDFLS